MDGEQVSVGYIAWALSAVLFSDTAAQIELENTVG